MSCRKWKRKWTRSDDEISLDAHAWYTTPRRVESLHDHIVPAGRHFAISLILFLITIISRARLEWFFFVSLCAQTILLVIDFFHVYFWRCAVTHLLAGLPFAFTLVSREFCAAFLAGGILLPLLPGMTPAILFPSFHRFVRHDGRIHSHPFGNHKSQSAFDTVGLSVQSWIFIAVPCAE